MRDLHARERFNDTAQVLLEERVVERLQVVADNGVVLEFLKVAVEIDVKGTRRLRGHESKHMRNEKSHVFDAYAVCASPAS